MKSFSTVIVFDTDSSLTIETKLDGTTSISAPDAVLSNVMEIAKTIEVLSVHQKVFNDMTLHRFAQEKTKKDG